MVRIMKETRHGSLLLRCEPRRSKISYFSLCGNAVLDGKRLHEKGADNRKYPDMQRIIDIEHPLCETISRPPAAII